MCGGSGGSSGGAVCVGALSGLLVSGGMSVDPYADYVLYDSFTDDDAVALTSHTPEKDSVEGGWQAGLNGVWKINTSKAYQDSGANAVNDVWIDAGISDFTLECTVYTGTAVAVGLCFRVKDGDDNLEIMIDATNNLLRIFKNVGGARTGLDDEAMVLAANTAYAMKVVVLADSIKVYIDDVLKNNTTDATHQTETGVGLWTWDAINNATWNDLTVVA